MNIINALSIPFYEFWCDEDLVDEVLLLLEKETTFSPTDTPSSDLQLSTNFYHKKIINWFEDCVDEVRKLHFDQTFKIEITNCWATKTNFASKHHIHRHDQAIVSGIFYLQDSNNGETFFLLDNPWHECSNFIGISESIVAKNKIRHTVKQEKGKLILYPGHIRHGTTVNKDKKFRYTIAFDTFFSGKSYKNAAWPYFEIKTTNIHEAYIKLMDSTNK